MHASAAPHVPAGPRLRVRGFAPGEVSVLVHRHVVQWHAGEAAFLWEQRDRAVRAPHYRLEHLVKLDERVEAHLDGLRVAGGAGARIAQAQLASGDAGAVFVAACLAFERHDARAMRDLLALGLAEPGFGRALVAALCWIEAACAQAPLARLLGSAAAAHRRVALDVFAARRLPPPQQALRAALDDGDAALRASACRAAGLLMRHDLADVLRALARDSQPECRYRAACSLAVLGERQAPEQVLDAARALPHRATEALGLAIRCGSTHWAHEQVRALAAAPQTLRLAFAAAASLGDPDAVDWLIAHMAAPELARAAGAAFSMITGADLAYLDLVLQEPPDAGDDAPRADADLPWPEPAAVRCWWQAQRPRFAGGQRYLAGLAVSPAAALQVLREGYQPERQAAAIELARGRLRLGYFPTAQRADRQRRALALQAAP